MRWPNEGKSCRTAILPAIRELRGQLVQALAQIRLRARWPAASALLMLAGIGLLTYVGSQYWSMHQAQQQLAAQWDRQQRGTILTTTASQPQPAIDPLLTRMQIPKINFEAMVVEGDSQKQLLLGPGHIARTPLPGEAGNSVITGHRDTFFRHIFELSKGDEIVVQRNGQTYRYSVTGKKIVKPEDVSVLAPTSEAELTLITCYPTYYIGPAPERLVVFSKLLATEANPPTARSSATY
jgi:sortase A